MVSRSKLTFWHIHSLQLIKRDLPAQLTQEMSIIYFSVILKVTLNNSNYEIGLLMITKSKFSEFCFLEKFLG